MTTIQKSGQVAISMHELAAANYPNRMIFDTLAAAGFPAKPNLFLLGRDFTTEIKHEILQTAMKECGAKSFTVETRVDSNSIIFRWR